ncbi:MAG: FadR/GntR family transcriptional regulator [Desulfohalobiaceae bacterium]
MFKEAKKNRIFQDVVEQIQDAILDGRFKAGDMLPSERELKDTFQVSRGTLREALRVLEQKGLIEIKVGVHGGTVVKSFGADQLSESLDFLVRSQKFSLLQLAEFREGIEGNVASLAAVRASQEDVAQLYELLDAAQAEMAKGSENWENFVNIDRKVHQVLAEVSRNPVYAVVLKSVHSNIHKYYENFLPKEEEILKENYQDLVRIVQAIEQGKADVAYDLAQGHVQRFHDYMQRFLPENTE